MSVRVWQPEHNPVERVARVNAGDLITIRTFFGGVGQYESTNRAIPPHIEYIPDQSETSEGNPSMCTTWLDGTPRLGIQLNGTIPSNMDVDDHFRIDLGCPFLAPFDGQVNLTGGQIRTAGVEIFYSLRRVPRGQKPRHDPTFTFRDMGGVFFSKIPRGTHSIMVREPAQLEFNIFGFVVPKNFDPGNMHPIGDLSQGSMRSVIPLTDVACVVNLL